ncbi:DNA-binding response OmpR family regulator [Flavobacterium croceum DSM 17960]|uniref:DNA-binding response OmpR family regulator n=1 Tax=Flavobacterium croceum DSM 17960 TaxID=1121886 RepID=A0A2S4N5N0_9FLAO|nr:response regulator transcription factor [Flavobacterium croceum]POS01042.1 DNA-binding response OmpR family regulator [Flavobacterium croceum DSM 17960]
MFTKYKIILVEDDLDFASILKRFLESNGFEVTWATNGADALVLFQNDSFDLCISDVMMPVMDGFTLAEKIIEKHPEMYFVFLSAKQLPADKIKGLQLGADDYIVKPFDTNELLLRIKNILKRKEKLDFSTHKQIQIGSFCFDAKRSILYNNSYKYQLTEKENFLLAYLIANKNQLVKRQDILIAIWKSNDFFSGRSMDVYLSKIRKYFASDPKIKLESIRNIGLELKEVHEKE